jgi:WD40 repeat protein
MRAFLVGLALGVAACSEAPPAPPVTATRVLELSGLEPLANAVGLSPDGSLVVTGDFEADLIARDVASGTERWKVRVKPRREQRRIDGVFFSPDGSLIVTTGHEAQTTEVWDAATGQSVAVLDIGRSRGVAFHPDERVLVVAGGGTIHVVDLSSGGRVVRTLPNAHPGDAIFAIAFSGDGLTLATISGEGSLKAWSWPALTLRTSTMLSGLLEAMSPVSLALTRRGTRAAANSILGRVHVVDIAKGREERVFANAAQGPGHGMHAELRYSLAFTDDGDWLFAPDTHDRGLRLLHVPSGQTFPVLQGEGPFYKAVALAMPASTVAFLRPGSAEGFGPYGIDVWRLTSRAQPH